MNPPQDFPTQPATPPADRVDSPDCPGSDSPSATPGGRALQLAQLITHHKVDPVAASVLLDYTARHGGMEAFTAFMMRTEMPAAAIGTFLHNWGYLAKNEAGEMVDA